MQELYAQTDAATGGWLSHASSLLAACTAQLAAAPRGGSPGGAGGGAVHVTHAAVTSGQLIPSLAKLLLFRLDGHIGPQHLWSSRNRGKQACFRMVRERFGPGCSYLVVGACVQLWVAGRLGWRARPAVSRPAYMLHCPARPCTPQAGDGLEEDEAAAAQGLPYVRVLLAPAAHYPQERVASWRPEAATGGAGLPFTQLSLSHLAAAAGLSVCGGPATAAVAAAAPAGSGLRPTISEGHGRGSSAALEALAASGGASEEESGGCVDVGGI